MRRIEVSDTGAATAPGGYANTGVHLGDVNLLTGLPVRTRYRQQVQRIAPPHLVGRDAELAELATFCTSARTAGAYIWWRARAWSGKSALMSWFVLHPPAGVRVVSFFVTARLSSQSDCAAFIDNVMEQLLTLLGEDLPPFLTESTREAHLLGLLDDAAEACRTRGEQFVLLVDGLDEDRGVHDEPDWHSIAALLPASPPAGMRVIVAGRPNPPIPADVPAHHPLRDDTIVRPLAPSPEAQAIREEMERDLKRLLHGTVTEQDLLGLVAAAGGGLSAADLGELTGWSPWQVDDHLRTVTGRSFSRRGSRYQPDSAPDVYLLGHEELQVAALEMLGPSRLDGYRKRLHAWAQHYQAGRWPADTPEYLLRGYFSMLNATGDVARLVSCATDSARQDRMLDLSGGDAAALAEITTTQDAVLGQTDPDLLAMARLAIHRYLLSIRNYEIPYRLPAVWTRLGYPARAEALAGAITDPERRALALLEIAHVLVARGHPAQALTLAKHAVDMTDAITLPSHVLALAMGLAGAAGDADRVMSLADQVEATASSTGGRYRPTGAFGTAMRLLMTMDEADRAVAVAAAIPERWVRASALAELAELVADTGDADRALMLAQQAEAVAPDQHARTLGLVSRAFAASGDLGHAARLATAAENAARSVVDPDDKAMAVVGAAWAFAKSGDTSRSVELASQSMVAARTADALAQSQVMAEVIRVLVSVGLTDQAARIVSEHADPYRLATPLAAVAEVLVAAGDAGRAVSLAEAAPEPYPRGEALLVVVKALVAAGDIDRAMSLAQSIDYLKFQAEAVTEVALALAENGDIDRAAELARQIEVFARGIPDPGRDATALATLAQALAVTGDAQLATQLATQAADLADAIGDLFEGDTSSPIEMQLTVAVALADTGDTVRAYAMAERSQDHQYTAPQEVAEALAKAGDIIRATALADTMTDPGDAADLLLTVAQVLAGSGEGDQAVQLVHRAQEMMRTTTDQGQRDYTTAHAASVLGDAGDLAGADALVRMISGPQQTVRARARAAQAHAAAGDAERAAELAAEADALAGTITNPGPRAGVLAAVVPALVAIDRTNRAVELAREADVLARSATGLFLVSTWRRQAAEALVVVDDIDRAVDLAGTLAKPHEHAYVLARIAVAVDPKRARELAGRILRLGEWQLSLGTLARVQPAAVRVIADMLAATGTPQLAQKVPPSSV